MLAGWKWCQAIVIAVGSSNTGVWVLTRECEGLVRLCECPVRVSGVPIRMHSQRPVKLGAYPAGSGGAVSTACPSSQL